MLKFQSSNRATRFFVGAVSLLLLVGCDGGADLPGLLTNPTDVTPPVVTSTSPSGGATGIATSSAITATFSELLDPSTVNSSTFLVSVTSTGVPIIGTISFNSSTQQAIFVPSSTLAPNTSYTVTLTTGIKDVAGNAMAANNVFTFTTTP